MAPAEGRMKVFRMFLQFGLVAAAGLGCYAAGATARQTGVVDLLALIAIGLWAVVALTAWTDKLRVAVPLAIVAFILTPPPGLVLFRLVGGMGADTPLARMEGLIASLVAVGGVLFIVIMSLPRRPSAPRDPFSQ